MATKKVSSIQLSLMSFFRSSTSGTTDVLPMTTTTTDDRNLMMAVPPPIIANHGSDEIKKTTKSSKSSTMTSRQRMAQRSKQEIIADRILIYGQDLDNAEKQCTKCETSKILGDFKSHPGSVDGLYSQCRQCVSRIDANVRRKRQARSDDEIREIQNKRYKTDNGNLTKTCTGCHQGKALNQFRQDTGQSDGLRVLCFECDHEGKRLREQLKANASCQNCRIQDPEVLEFAHLNRAEKCRSKSGRPVCVSGMGPRAIEKEIPKTKVLCRCCHRIETHQENDKLYGYTKTKKRKQKHINYVIQRKLEHKACIDCHRKVTIDTVMAFDFDHLPGFEKVANISQMVGNRSPFKKISDEIAKCALRCANCHLKITNARRATTTNSSSIFV